MKHDRVDEWLKRRSRLARAVAAVALFVCAAVVGGVPSASRGAEPQSGLGGNSVILVMPSGDAHLLLGGGLEQLDGGFVWHVTYLAGSDPAELRRPEADERLASVARDLADAFRPLAQVAQARRLLVTAVAGKPGRSGAIEQRAFVRDGETWRADGDVRWQTIANVPGPDAEVVRHPEEEAGARDAAAEFLSDASRADYDAAWAKASAVVKVATSRTEFERHLAALGWVDARCDEKPNIMFAASVERFLPGTFVEAWVACDGADRGVRALALRLDDDMEWRVAEAAQLTFAPARSETPAASL